MAEHMYSIVDLARYLSVSEKQLIRMRDAGELPPCWIGNDKWLADDYDFWLESGRPDEAICELYMREVGEWKERPRDGE